MASWTRHRVQCSNEGEGKKAHFMYYWLLLLQTGHLIECYTNTCISWRFDLPWRAILSPSAMALAGQNSFKYINRGWFLNRTAGEVESPTASILLAIRFLRLLKPCMHGRASFSIALRASVDMMRLRASTSVCLYYAVVIVTSPSAV